MNVIGPAGDVGLQANCLFADFLGRQVQITSASKSYTAGYLQQFTRPAPCVPQTGRSRMNVSTCRPHRAHWPGPSLSRLAGAHRPARPHGPDSQAPSHACESAVGQIRGGIASRLCLFPGIETAILKTGHYLSRCGRRCRCPLSIKWPSQPP